MSALLPGILKILGFLAGILLLILKIIGIILLVVLCILLLILLILLFVPIRYQLGVERAAEGIIPNAEAEITWFFRAVKVTAAFREKKLKLQAKLLFKVLFSRGEEPEKKEAETKEPEAAQTLQNEPVEEETDESDSIEEAEEETEDKETEDKETADEAAVEEVTGEVTEEAAEDLEEVVSEPAAEPPAEPESRKKLEEKLTAFRNRLQQKKDLLDEKVKKQKTERSERKQRKAEKEAQRLNENTAQNHVTDEKPDKKSDKKSSKGFKGKIDEKVTVLKSKLLELEMIAMDYIFAFVSRLFEILPDLIAAPWTAKEKAEPVFEILNGEFSNERFKKYERFLTPSAKKVYKKAIHEVLRLIKKYLPREIGGEVAFGTGDPAMSAWIYGAVQNTLSAKANRLILDVDLQEAGLDGNVWIRGHIRFVHVLSLLVRMALHRETRKFVFSLLKKGGKK